MNIAQMRTLAPDQLAALQVSLKKEQFNLRFQAATGEVLHTHRFAGLRKELAWVETVRTEQRRATQSGPGGRGRRGAPPGAVYANAPRKDPERANLELPRSDVVENELMQAFKTLSARSVERSAAIESLLRLGRQHHGRRIVARGLQRRLASIVPALVEELFDASASVRWSAAYALAALRSPLKFKGDDIPEPSRDLERAVREELGRFLGDRSGDTLSNVKLTKVELVGATVRVAGLVTVLTHLPLELDGRRPSLNGPGWMRKAPPALSVEITDRLGLLDETFPAEPADQTAAPGELVRRAFAFDLPAQANTVLAVHVILNDRRIAVHHIDSVGLLSD